MPSRLTRLVARHCQRLTILHTPPRRMSKGFSQPIESSTRLRLQRWVDRFRRVARPWRIRRVWQGRGHTPLPARLRRQFSPAIRGLEPRLVLNASAELSPLGQLLVTGTDASETIQLEVDSSGGVLLTDDLNQVIPIDGHPTDPGAPLDVSEIGSGQIVFALGEGDDLLRLQIPTGLDVTVAGGGGNDQTQITLPAGIGADAENSVQIESESIVFDPAVDVFGPARFGLTDDELLLQGNVFIGSTAGTTLMDLDASSLSITGDLSFVGDTVLRAGPISVSGNIHVEPSAIARMEAAINDGTAGTTEVIKSGGGTLVLAADNLYSGTTEIRQGTLVVDGSIESDANVSVFAGGRLEGTGQIGGQVVAAADATIAPGLSSTVPTSASIESIRIDGLEAPPSSVLAFEFDELQSDRIVIASGQVSIDQAVLDVSLDANIDPATEFVLIENEGSDPVGGNFRVLFDVDGSSLPAGRTILDGDTILDSFGSPGRAAHLTYFGGDGNDVTIVTAGGFDVTSAGVTLISRNGVNLEIRTGNDLAAAAAATPVIRPILGRADETVRILGSSADDSLWVDVDGFFDASPGAREFRRQHHFRRWRIRYRRRSRPTVRFIRDK